MPSCWIHICLLDLSLFFSMWILNSSSEDVCIHIDFQVMCSLCLYDHCFIFFSNVKLRPEVIVIKLEQTHLNINHSCCSHACYTNKNKSLSLVSHSIWCPCGHQTLVQTLINPLASLQCCRSPLLCFLHSVFEFISWSREDFEILLLTARGSWGCSVTVLFPDIMYCMWRRWSETHSDSLNNQRS